MTIRALQAKPAQAFQQANGAALRLRKEAVDLSAAWANGTDFFAVQAALKRATTWRDEIETFAAVSGLNAFAQDQVADPTYDMAAELLALAALIDTFVLDVVAALPSAGRWLTVLEFDVNNDIVPRTFTGAQTASIRVSLDAIADFVV